MSNYKAIEGVSRSLRSLLQDRMQEKATVTIAPPDAKVPGVADGRVNLYLYQINENAYLKNQEVPGQGHPAAYGHPPLSLDLYYLITAYGQYDATADADLHAQRLLGDAMQVLHDLPVITDGLELSKPDRPGPAGAPILDLSLRGELEKVKITLQPATLEDLSKLWSAMPQANFRCSVVYRVSVVQIESRLLRDYPQPVGELPEAGPRVYAATLHGPRINELHVIRQKDRYRKERTVPYARIDDTLVILGYGLAGANTRVSIGPVNVAIPNDKHRDEHIEVTIPDDPQLQPGPLVVKVVQDVLVRTPLQPSAGFESNLAVFMLVPRPDECDNATIPGTPTIQGARLYEDGKECLTLVSNKIVHAEDYTTKTPTKIAFKLPAGLGQGDHAVRVRVDGVESINPIKVTIP